MVAVVTNKSRIHDALRTIALTGDFRLVSYPPDGTYSIGATSVLPATCEVNELSADFITAKEWKRSFKQQRGEWIFQMKLAFDKEITSELFEASLLDRPVILAPDSVNALPAVIIRLHDAHFQHPPRQQSSNGSRATYRFVAETRPV